MAEVLADAIPMRGRMMHDTSSQLTFQPYSSDPEDAINSVSRGSLNMTLLDAAETYDSVRVIFGARCIDADIEAPAAVMLDEKSGTEFRAEGDVLIGADGAFSAVRGRMQRSDRFDFSQDYLAHGYKELTIPPAAECGRDSSEFDGFALDPNALHIWPRGGFMMIALPNADRTFTCTLFWPFEGEASFESVADGDAAVSFFVDQFPDAVPLLTSLPNQFNTNPVGSLATIRCFPWHVDGRVALVGDAAHAVVPFYGQGMNCAFEDCRVLDELVAEHNGDFERVLPAYTSARKENADAIADMAITNFTEMRDSVANPMFLLRKRVEQVMHRIDPSRFTPLYNLVSFSNMPYAAARRQGSQVVEQAEAIADRIGVGAAQRMQDEEFERAIAKCLPPISEQAVAG